MLPPMSRLVSPAVLVAILAATRGAGATDCFQGISEGNARAVYDALSGARPIDGCRLEEVRTEMAQMTVIWKKGDTLEEPVLVVPSACVKVATTRGKVLSTIVPPSTANACPLAVRTMSTLVQSEALGQLAPVVSALPVPDVEGRPLRIPTRAFVLAGAVSAAVLAGVVLVVLRWRRSKRSRAAGRDVPDVGA